VEPGEVGAVGVGLVSGALGNVPKLARNSARSWAGSAGESGSAVQGFWRAGGPGAMAGARVHTVTKSNEAWTGSWTGGPDNPRTT
jgi:hypothetical protein